MDTSFVLYTESWEAISLLTDQQRSALMQAVFSHHGACPMPDMDAMTKAIFLMMRPRFDANKAKYQEICEKRRASGQKGGIAKGESAEAKKQMLNCSKQNSLLDSDSVPVPDTEEDKETPLTPHGGESKCVTPAPARKAKQPTAYSPDFEHFWQLYPRKIGKDAAWKAYQRRKHEIPTGENMAAILARHAQTEQWQRDGGQYIPHPATWLNQGRWADDVTPVVGIASRETPPSPEAQKAMKEILRERTPEELEKNREASRKYRQEWLRKRGIDECLSAQG